MQPPTTIKIASFTVENLYARPQGLPLYGYEPHGSHRARLQRCERRLEAKRRMHPGLMAADRIGEEPNLPQTH